MCVYKIHCILLYIQCILDSLTHLQIIYIAKQDFKVHTTDPTVQTVCITQE